LTSSLAAAQAPASWACAATGSIQASATMSSAAASIRAVFRRGIRCRDCRRTMIIPLAVINASSLGLPDNRER